MEAIVTSVAEMLLRQSWQIAIVFVVVAAMCQLLRGRRRTGGTCCGWWC